MDDRVRTVMAVAIILGLFVLLIVIIGAILTRGNLISPVPEEGTIKIIFISPTPAPTPVQSGSGPGASPSGIKKS